MTDPWADVRERVRYIFEEEGSAPDKAWAEEWHMALEDLDALLAVVPFARHKKECQIARAWGNGPGGTFTEPHCNCGFEKALAALPEHLKGNTND